MFETKHYTGGSDDGAYWQVGGTPSTDITGPNIYKLEITHPDHATQTFYINRGGVGSATVQAVDYTKTIQAYGGSTFNLSADSVAEIVAPHIGEYRELSHAISVGGITDPAQPYLGQWANMVVLSVVPS